jgi:hypothetical protein
MIASLLFAIAITQLCILYLLVRLILRFADFRREFGHLRRDWTRLHVTELVWPPPPPKERG